MVYLRINLHLYGTRVPRDLSNSSNEFNLLFVRYLRFLNIGQLVFFASGKPCDIIRLRNGDNCSNCEKVNMSEFLTAYDLSKKLNIPKNTIYLLARKGGIPGAMKIGKHWRFRKSMIDEWIEEQTKPRHIETDVKLEVAAKSHATNPRD